MAITRILAMGDLHCGHRVGLTPPAYQLQSAAKSTTKRSKWAAIQKELWNEFDTILGELQPIHRVLCSGDMLDGKGKRSGGTEQITSDLEEQSDMAVNVFDHVRLFGPKGRAAKQFKIVGVFGTPYHVDSDGDDWEPIIAERAGFHKLGSHEWPSVNGLVFDLKHKIGNTTIPHGRGTAISKEWLANQLWFARDEQPKANIVLRGHVHRFFHVGDADFLGMTLPALQGMGSKYGARECSMPIDWGVVHFDVDEKGRLVDWQPHIVRIAAQKAKVTVL